MSRMWFTADLHLDHANIILYTKRPFYTNKDVWSARSYGIEGGEWVDNLKWNDDKSKIRCCKWMNNTLVDNWNKIISPDDLVYHLGDFCFNRKGTFKRFTNKLNGTIVHLQGNHDYNNGVKTCVQKAIMKFGNKTILAQHIPPVDDLHETYDAHVMSGVDMVLCGHVHDSWKYKLITFWAYGCKYTIPCINVGVDVWDYKPVSIDSILKLYHKIKKE